MHCIFLYLYASSCWLRLPVLNKETTYTYLLAYLQGRRSWGGDAPNILLKGPCINRAPPIIRLQHVFPCQSVMKIMKCLYCLNCPKFNQLITKKIIRIFATRCQIFGVKMYKIRFRLGLHPRPIWGAYSAPSLVELTALPLTPWLHLRG